MDKVLRDADRLPDEWLRESGVLVGVGWLETMKA
jgi:hypothetical protein